MRKPIHLLIIWILLGLLSFFYLDPYISNLCRDLSHISRSYIKMISLTLSPSFHIVFWWIIYLYTKYRCPHTIAFSISRQIAPPLLISLSLVYCMKMLLGRARPELLADNRYGFYFFMQNHHYHSFPSGHAAVSACLFVPLLYSFPRFKIYWIILPIVLSSSRILLNYHFTSDILASGIICYVVQGVYRKYRDKKERKSDYMNLISYNNY